MSSCFTIEKLEDNIVNIVFNRQDKDMNILSRSVAQELDQVLSQLEEDAELNGLIFSSAKKDFIVGADISEIASLESSEAATAAARDLEALFRRFSELDVPTVAAIDGLCLGGGLELALCFRWRVATDLPKTKFSLPEIKLGVIPGCGGTQRLPRLIGIQPALDMILTGKNVIAKKAFKLGLIDAVVPSDLLLSESMKFVRKSRKKSPSFFGRIGLSSDFPKLITEGNALGRKLMAKKAREMVEEKTKGFYPASFKALEAVFEGFEMPLDQGLKLESALFGQLAMTRESASLIHLFNSTNEIKKDPYQPANLEKFGKNKPSTVGVIGAGFMGAGISAVSADKGLKVLLSDPNGQSVGRALSLAKKYFDGKLKRKRMKPFEVESAMGRISPGLNTTGFEKCEIVIEAVFEDLQLKQNILAEFEDKAKNDWIFASNTSALPISKIAEETKYPERVIGMHFFSPVEKMPLLEVVVTDKTAPWVTGRTVQLGRDLGKQVIVVKDSPGFYTTRALAFYLAEAAHIMLEGHAIDQIDKAFVNFGFPVGPITLIDEVGIDVGIHVLETIEKAFPERMTCPTGFQKITESGRLGRKNSKGFYLYENDKKKGVDPNIYEILDLKAQETELNPDTLVDRCLMIFVNESVRCLEEGILPDSYSGDIGAVFGLGFPPFWGGPFKYVDLVGVRSVVEQLEDLAKDHGERFKPCDMLKSFAEKDSKFFPKES